MTTRTTKKYQRSRRRRRGQRRGRTSARKRRTVKGRAFFRGGFNVRRFLGGVATILASLQCKEIPINIQKKVEESEPKIGLQILKNWVQDDDQILPLDKPNIEAGIMRNFDDMYLKTIGKTTKRYTGNSKLPTFYEETHVPSGSYYDKNAIYQYDMASGFPVVNDGSAIYHQGDLSSGSPVVNDGSAIYHQSQLPSGSPVADGEYKVHDM